MRKITLPDALRVVIDPFDNGLAMGNFIAAEQMAVHLMDWAYFGGKGKLTEALARAELTRLGAEDIRFHRGSVKVGGKIQAPQGITFKHGGTQFVCLAGTNDGRDVGTDLDFFPEACQSGGSVHGGVKKYWEAFYGMIFPYLERTLPVSVYCHSLGGGAGEHGGTELKLAGWHVVAVKTAGALRSATDHRAKIVNRAIGPVYDRYVFGSDTVPGWPRDGWGYEHAVEAWEFAPNGKLTKSEGAAKMARVLGRLNGAAHLRWLTKWEGARTAGVAHHLLDHGYKGAIGRAYKVGL